MPICTENEITIEEKMFMVIPHWMEPIQEKKPVNCDSIFETGEELPKFKGGDLGLLKYNMDVIAPIIQESNRKNGSFISRINYSLLISKEGSVLESEILSNVDEQLRVSLEKQLNKMPDWIARKS